MTSLSHRLRPMTLDDYAGVMELLKETGGVGLRDADSFEGIARYLARNPGMSFVGEADGVVAGCVFGGHDGRRGYLYHLAVALKFRQRGIGRSLVASAIAAIAAEGIGKCHIDVFADNAEGLRFWQAIGWHWRGGVEAAFVYQVRRQQLLAEKGKTPSSCPSPQGEKGPRNFPQREF